MLNSPWDPITLPLHAPMICTKCGLPLRCWGLDDYTDWQGRRLLVGKYICKDGHKHQKTAINLQEAT